MIFSIFWSTGCTAALEVPSNMLASQLSCLVIFYYFLPEPYTPHKPINKEVGSSEFFL